jgi:hypothetical protein
MCQALGSTLRRAPRAEVLCVSLLVHTIVVYLKFSTPADGWVKSNLSITDCPLPNTSRRIALTVVIDHTSRVVLGLHHCRLWLCYTFRRTRCQLCQQLVHLARHSFTLSYTSDGP